MYTWNNFSSPRKKVLPFQSYVLPAIKLPPNKIWILESKFIAPYSVGLSPDALQ